MRQNQNPRTGECSRREQRETGALESKEPGRGELSHYHLSPDSTGINSADEKPIHPPMPRYTAPLNLN